MNLLKKLFAGMSVILVFAISFGATLGFIGYNYINSQQLAAADGILVKGTECPYAIIWIGGTGSSAGDSMSQWIINTFGSETYIPLANGGGNNAVDPAVIQNIKTTIAADLNQGHKVLLIGHSLGAVISEEVGGQYSSDDVTVIPVDPPTWSGLVGSRIGQTLANNIPLISDFNKLVAGAIANNISKITSEEKVINANPLYINWTKGMAQPSLLHDPFDSLNDPTALAELTSLKSEIVAAINNCIAIRVLHTDGSLAKSYPVKVASMTGGQAEKNNTDSNGIASFIFPSLTNDEYFISGEGTPTENELSPNSIDTGTLPVTNLYTLQLKPVVNITSVSLTRTPLDNSAGVMSVISWKTKGFDPNETVNIDLTDTNGNSLRNIAQNIPYNNTYSWSSDLSIPSGQYKIVISSATVEDPNTIIRGFSPVFTLKTSGMPAFKISNNLVPPASGAACVTNSPFTITLSTVDPSTGKPESLPKGDTYSAVIYLESTPLPAVTSSAQSKTINATLTTNSSGAIINGVTLPFGPQNMSANITVKDANGNPVGGTYYSNNIQPFMTVGTCVNVAPTFILIGTLFNSPSNQCLQNNYPVTAIVSSPKPITGLYTYTALLFVDDRNLETLSSTSPTITFNAFEKNLSNSASILLTLKGTTIEKVLTVGSHQVYARVIMRDRTDGTAVTYTTNTQSISIIAPPAGSPSCNPPPTEYIIVPPPGLGGSEGDGNNYQPTDSISCWDNPNMDSFECDLEEEVGSGNT